MRRNRNGQRERKMCRGDDHRKGRYGASGQRRLADATIGKTGWETKEKISNNKETGNGMPSIGTSLQIYSQPGFSSHVAPAHDHFFI